MGINHVIIAPKLSPWSTVILKKLIFAQLVKHIPRFLEPEGLLPRLQEPATGHYPESDESSSHPHIILL